MKQVTLRDFFHTLVYIDEQRMESLPLVEDERYVVWVGFLLLFCIVTACKCCTAGGCVAVLLHCALLYRCIVCSVGIVAMVVAVVILCSE